ncbi:MAG: glycosyltransferase [Geminicoccaceae bacterium]
MTADVMTLDAARAGSAKVEAMQKDDMISVVVPVTTPLHKARERHLAVEHELKATGRAFEFIYVLDGGMQDYVDPLRDLYDAGHPIKILCFDQTFGESAALTAGFKHSRGSVLMTLPSYTPIKPTEISNLLAALDGVDMVVGRRAQASGFTSLRARVLSTLLEKLLESPFKDLGSGVRVLQRRIIDEIAIYGDQHMFLPLLALKNGFKVKEVDVERESVTQGARRRTSITWARILDVISIYFLIRFTKRPFRFFGGIGGVTLALGGLLTLYLVVARLFFDVGLGDRPALILSTLMIVLGFQIIAVGLIGEIITFTHAKDMKDYKVDKVIG